MSKTIIKASDLIHTLKNAKMFGTSKDFLDKLLLMRSEYEKSKGLAFLSVEIYTDNDFKVNDEHEVFKGVVTIGDSETPHDALVRYIDSLVFSTSPNAQYKVDDFKSAAKDEMAKYELNNTFHLSTGGNQTLDVSVVSTSGLIDFGVVCVDLSL